MLFLPADKFLNIEMSDTLIVGVLSFIGGIITVLITSYFGLWQYCKQRFSSVVTEGRKEYLKTFRDVSANFCYITDLRVNSDNLENIRLQKEYAYQLKLLLNPIEYPDWWDGEIVEMIDSLINIPEKETLKKLVALLQASCDIEWKGITKEGIKGKLTSKRKRKLKKDIYQEYKLYCKKIKL